MKYYILHYMCIFDHCSEVALYQKMELFVEIGKTTIKNVFSYLFYILIRYIFYDCLDDYQSQI